MRYMIDCMIAKRTIAMLQELTGVLLILCHFQLCETFGRNSTAKNILAAWKHLRCTSPQPNKEPSSYVTHDYNKSGHNPLKIDWLIVVLSCPLQDSHLTVLQQMTCFPHENTSDFPANNQTKNLLDIWYMVATRQGHHDPIWIDCLIVVLVPFSILRNIWQSWSK